MPYKASFEIHESSNESSDFLQFEDLIAINNSPIFQIHLYTVSPFRNSHQRCCVIKDVLRYFIKFTRKHLCQSLFFNKVLDLRPANLLKKGL